MPILLLIGQPRKSNLSSQRNNTQMAVGIRLTAFLM